MVKDIEISPDGISFTFEGRSRTPKCKSSSRGCEGYKSWRGTGRYGGRSTHIWVCLECGTRWQTYD